MTLLAAFQVLLYRYTGQEDILVGSPTAGRSSAAAGRAGRLLRQPDRAAGGASGDPTFEGLLAQVRRTVLAAFEHQDYPFRCWSSGCSRSATRAARRSFR